jgi:hypothetical protein
MIFYGLAVTEIRIGIRKLASPSLAPQSNQDRERKNPKIRPAIPWWQKAGLLIVGYALLAAVTYIASFAPNVVLAVGEELRSIR